RMTPVQLRRCDPKVVNTLGLVLELLGVLILFWFGMPFHVPTGGVTTMSTGEIDQAAVALELRYTIFGYVGLALLVIGTVLQITATWLKPGTAARLRMKQWRRHMRQWRRR